MKACIDLAFLIFVVRGGVIYVMRAGPAHLAGNHYARCWGGEISKDVVVVDGFIVVICDCCQVSRRQERAVSLNHVSLRMLCPG